MQIYTWRVSGEWGVRCWGYLYGVRAICWRVRRQPKVLFWVQGLMKRALCKFPHVDLTCGSTSEVINIQTRDLAPKADVLRCRQPSPYTTAGWHVRGGGTFHGEWCISEGVALSMGGGAHSKTKCIIIDILLCKIGPWTLAQTKHESLSDFSLQVTSK